MPNMFPVCERQLISTLAEDLHLSVTWDEYDEDDQNIVTWRFPGALEQPLPEPEEVQKTNGDAEGEGEWENVADDEESKAAVDRALKKYEKAQAMDDDEDGGFDARYDRSMKEKMDGWKRGYYKVHLLCFFLPRWTMCADRCWMCRANSGYITTTRRICSSVNTHMVL
jgi:5'-3' exoribonuclease 1